MEEEDLVELQRDEGEFKFSSNALCIHSLTTTPTQYWRRVIPDNIDIKKKILTEIRSVPCARHPGYDQIVEIMKSHFHWREMSTDIRTFMLSCPMSQIEKSEHALPNGILQPLQLQTEKWQEVALDFVVKLPSTSSGYDSIFTIVDIATKMVHLIPSKKAISTVEVAYLYWAHVGSLHGLPKSLI